MANTPIGLQLYSVRGECSNDLAATLRNVADLGYAAVEPYGYGGEELSWLGNEAGEIRKMLDDCGLTCCGIHLRTAALMGDNLARSIEFNRILGNRFLIVAADKPRMSSAEGIMELKGILENAADAARPAGMFTGYHAHGFDFETIEGRTAWDILFSATRDDIVMQMDTGNCMSGGGDPIAILRKFAGRARSVHLKEFNAPDGGTIGSGDTNWPEVLRLCGTQHNTEWYVVEECGPQGLGYDVPRRALEALRAMGM